MTPSEKTEPQPKPTPYLVLRRGDTDGTWIELGVETAASAEQARRNAAKVNEGDTFVAVPMRSWKPRSRKVEQVTKETWS